MCNALTSGANSEPEVKFLRATSPSCKQFECGHEGPESWAIDIWGFEVEIVGTTMCPTCAQEAIVVDVIRCAMCARPILPPAHVSIYNCTKHELGRVFKVGDGFLGCDCGAPCGFYNGHWLGVEQGYVPRESSRKTS